MPISPKKEKKSKVLLIIILIIVFSSIAYFISTKTPSSERFNIKTAGGEYGYKASFINLVGKDAEDKKIGLSDDYWTSGKFK